MVIRLFCLIGFLCCAETFCAQSVFFHVFSSGGRTEGADIHVLEDNTYLMVGSTNEFNQGSSQMYLGRLSSNGQLIWSKDIGGSEPDRGQRILSVGNKFYAFGHSSSTTNGDFDGFFVKGNLNGDIEFSDYFGGAGWEFVEDVILLADSTFMVVGTTDATPDGLLDGMLWHLDTNGNVLNEWSTSQSGEDKWTSAAFYDDSTFLVSGYRWNSDSNFHVAVISRLRLDGTPVWNKVFGANHHHQFLGLTYTSDGIYGVGQYFTAVDSNWHEYFIRCNADGFLLEAIEGYDIGSKIFKDVIKLDTFKYVMAGDADDQYSFAGGTDVAYFRFSETLVFSGSAVEVKANNPDVHGAMKTTPDLGYIAIGTTSSFGAGEKSIYVLKTGPNNQYPNTQNPTNFEIVSVGELSDAESPLLLYPNPCTSVLNIPQTNDMITHLTITDVSGRLILTTHYTPVLSMESLRNGHYLIEIVQKSGRVSRRAFVKQ